VKHALLPLNTSGQTVSTQIEAGWEITFVQKKSAWTWEAFQKRLLFALNTNRALVSTACFLLSFPFLFSLEIA